MANDAREETACHVGRLEPKPPILGFEGPIITFPLNVLGNPILNTLGLIVDIIGCDALLLASLTGWSKIIIASWGQWKELCQL